MDTHRLEMRAEEDQNLVGGGESAEVAFLAAQDEFGVGQQVD
ncbi:MAG: hypothetical protein QOG46_2609, partial [Pseudonocardiales bacterium]|nr:hypothetical protein [Pseudonocardiales bacterium]